MCDIPSRRTEYRRQLRERLLYHFCAYNYSISAHEKHTRNDKSQMSEGLRNMFIDDSLYVFSSHSQSVCSLLYLFSFVVLVFPSVPSL
ncbi:hypothetical protein PM082_012422 [Marasmius tenuissimus]|nr:hypothetical protein PM082_012422 [Marasmius tenuissimus]